MFFIEGFISWLKTSLENGDLELKLWVESEEWDDWCGMWNGVELDASRTRALLLSCWNDVPYAPHQGPRRYVRRD